MRTTVDFEDDLLKIAKSRAAAAGTTLSALVQLSLKAQFAIEQTQKTRPFVLVEAGHPDGRCPSAQEIAKLLDDEDQLRLK